MLDSLRIRDIFISVLLVTIPAIAQEPGGGYSRLATPIWGARHSFVLRSPDGSKAIVVNRTAVKENWAPGGFKIDWQVTVRAKGKEYRTRIGDLVDSEVEWSPDSKTFFLTYSDGGNIGRFHVKIVYVGSSGLRETEPIPDGRKLLVPNCYSPEEPNVGAIRWMGSTLRLLIAVEVPPHSSCASMGTFRAYEITVPGGKVLKQYGQLRAKALFANSIGEELVGADDECVRHPETCVPPGLKIGSTRPQIKPNKYR